jgi:hypothetical protein
VYIFSVHLSTRYIRKKSVIQKTSKIKIEYRGKEDTAFGKHSECLQLDIDSKA